MVAWAISRLWPSAIRASAVATVRPRWTTDLAFAKDRNLYFPLLADFEPKGAVARAYHVYRAEEGASERALYVIDADGIMRWSYISPVGVNPGANGILRALENLGKEGAS